MQVMTLLLFCYCQKPLSRTVRHAENKIQSTNLDQFKKFIILNLQLKLVILIILICIWVLDLSWKLHYGLKLRGEDFKIPNAYIVCLQVCFCSSVIKSMMVNHSFSVGNMDKYIFLWVGFGTWNVIISL